MKNIRLTLIALVAFLQLNGQTATTHYCGAHLKEQALWHEQPHLEQAYREMLRMQKNNAKSEDSVIITIPVVFHILHEYGPENITDAQIYRQMEILNEDFMKLNADTAIVIPEFLPVLGNARIQFVLATMDPWGNCTSGINRYFTHETRIGDDNSKLNFWPRFRYLNIWVVRSMENGVAGYAYLPSSVEGSNFWRDGIMIRHNFIGDIGTGSPLNSRALTHEVGHYLGLAHPWGPTNNPGLPVNCTTDDGIDDTPNTIGWTTCNLQGASCGSLDNVQNFMDYSYCSTMFTTGQVNFMRTILNSTISSRRALWLDYNHNQSIPEGITCPPVADFHAPRTTVCRNEAIQFTNHSWRISNPSYSWHFPGGTPEFSTEQNPTVYWTESGWKKIKLTVTGDNGEDTKELDSYLFVSHDISDYSGPRVLDFDNEPSFHYIIENPGNDASEWQVTPQAGINGSKAIFLRNISPYPNPPLYSNEFFFVDRRGGKRDAFITPSFDLSNTSGVNVTFSYSTATNAFSLANMTEELSVFVSRDCGKTWQLRRRITGMDLITNGAGFDDFFPGPNSIWREDGFTLPTSGSDNNIRLKFEYTASDFSNNIAIDNIRIGGVLSLENQVNTLSESVVYPNPSASGNDVFVKTGLPSGERVQISVIDAQGRTIGEEMIQINSDEAVRLNEISPLTQGIYFVKLQNNALERTHKLVIH